MDFLLNLNSLLEEFVKNLRQKNTICSYNETFIPIIANFHSMRHCEQLVDKKTAFFVE